VGALGRHLHSTFNLNRVPLGGTARLHAKQLPGVTTIGEDQTTGASSYHALQATFERRFSHGFGFNANTTWTHLLDNSNAAISGGSGGNHQVLQTTYIDDYGNGDLDIRSRVIVTDNYEPPYGRSFTGLKGVLVRGWHANLINIWSTGLPFTVLNGTNVDGTDPNGGADQVNVVGKPIRESCYTRRPAQSTVLQR
jgi:hypothetical protein